MGNANAINVDITVNNRGSAEVKRFGADLDTMAKSGTKSVGVLASSSKALEGALGGLQSKIVAVGSAYLGAQGIGAVIKMADTYSLLESKMKLVSKSAEEFASNYNSLFAISQKTGSSFEANVGNFSSLSLALRDANISSKETLQIFDLMNKSLTVAGASTAEASSFMLQFKQALGSGKLQGDEFRAMMESNSYFGSMLAKALQTDVAGLREMSKEGKLTTDVLRAAFPAMAEQIEKDFSGVTKTIGRAMMELQNAFGDILNGSNKATGGTNEIAKSISDLAKTIGENRESISNIFSGVIKGADLAVSAIIKVYEAWQDLYNRSDANAKGLPISQALSMTSQQIREFLSDANGLGALKVKFKELSDEISQISKVREFEKDNGGWTAAAEARYQSLLREKELIGQQVDANQNLQRVIKEGFKDAWQVAAEAEAEAFRRMTAEGSKFKDPWQRKQEIYMEIAEDLTKIDAKLREEEKKQAEEAQREAERYAEEMKQLSAGMTDYIKQQTLSEYEYKRWAVEKEVEDKREAAGNNKAIQDEITAYEIAKLAEIDKQRSEFLLKDLERWKESTAGKIEMMNAMVAAQNTTVDTFVKLQEINSKGDEKLKEDYRKTLDAVEKYEKKHLGEMVKAWEEFGHDVRREFTDVLASGLKGEFNSIGEAWSSLLDGLYNAFMDLLAKIIIAWAASELFGTGGIFQIGDGKAFSIGSGGGGSAGSVAGGLASSIGISAAGSAIKDYVMTNYLTPAYNAIFGTSTTGGAAGAGGATTAAGAGVAGGAAGGYGGVTTTTGAISYGGSEVAVSGAGAGAGGAGAGGSMMAAAGPAASIAAAAFVAANIIWGNRSLLRDDLNQMGATPGDIAGVAGIKANGELYSVSKETAQALGLLDSQLSQTSAISIDAANGVMVLADKITNPETGLVTGLGYGIEVFDAASGQWRKSEVSFGNLLDTMEGINPTSADAIQSTARYVATMAGVPTVADELAIAFMQMQSGIYGLAGVAQEATGTIFDAIGQINEMGGQVGYSAEGGYTTAWGSTGPESTYIDMASEHPGGMAAGGWHSGGWVNVGENGPEKVFLPPSRVFSNSDSAKLVKGDADEIRELKEVLISLGMNLATYMRKQEKVLSSWDKIGMPAQRT